MIKIINGDCLEIMKGMEDNSVDLVLTDPPYGIEGGKGNRSKTRVKGIYSGNYFSDTREYIKTHVIPAIKEGFRVAMGVVITPGSVCLDLYPRNNSFGCLFQPASCGIQHWGYADSQPILYYGKYWASGKKLKKCSYMVTEKPSYPGFPCSKPMRVWSQILEDNSQEGDTILDLFMGSGTTGVACQRMGRNFIGIEINPEYCAMAEKRIKDDMPLLAGAVNDLA